jgi:hypothetical protein
MAWGSATSNQDREHHPAPGSRLRSAGRRVSTLYGHLYPGEMDRYADRLNEAAEMSDAAADAAKMRPDDDENEQDDA